ncbi:hypothetical protein EDC18_103274 [Natranaerovirga pectinivora]|uniref:Uncharacterized protein n=1 Tax=Natranaerovirga pectinivora TaxID=682400 RepID=A0A4R3MLN7_9FIRM|nr:LDCC motif putative metal-binding protein [Natranaerovirga pectinivora]TCT15568.1 hypothetical protein EDC18_103274 [Natranaerovirga pectinivora]
MKWLKKLIDKIAQTNNENLPSGEKLDCCNIKNDKKNIKK